MYSVLKINNLPIAWDRNGLTRLGNDFRNDDATGKFTDNCAMISEALIKIGLWQIHLFTSAEHEADG